MKDKVILLVEDNADDEALTRRALAKNNIQNTIIVAHDGVEALDCVFGTGPHEGDPVVPVVVLDRKSTRLNSSHTVISYAVFCLKKKNNTAKRACEPAATDASATRCTAAATARRSPPP